MTGHEKQQYPVVIMGVLTQASREKDPELFPKKENKSKRLGVRPAGIVLRKIGPRRRLEKQIGLRQKVF
jgi:hypothetical protein